MKDRTQRMESLTCDLSLFFSSVLFMLIEVLWAKIINLFYFEKVH